MDSFSENKPDSGVLVPPRPVMYSNMVCQVDSAREVVGASSSPPTLSPCDPSVTQLPPPLTTITSEHHQVSHQIQTTEPLTFTKDDVTTVYTSSPTPTITKITHATVPMGNMSQLCKVCGEPAAGFHFGAFTCEGCKSFFGRTYNNLSSLNECKNSGRCVINKKTRTSCKSCRLRKCLVVGMSKSGSRYGRRSNWFKIHYLMQGTNNNNNNNNSTSNNNNNNNSMPSVSLSSSLPGHSDSGSGEPTFSLAPTSTSLALMSPASEAKTLSPDFKFGGSDFQSGLECRRQNSPATSSSESHHSDSSDLGEKPVFPHYLEHLSPKDLLSLCKWPAIAPNFSPYVSPSPLAPHRYLYPYLPPLLSMYSSRQQYLDSLLQMAQQQSEAGESEEEPRNLASPSREFTPPTKFFKPSVARPPHELRVPVKTCAGHSPVRGMLPLRQDPPRPPGYNPGHDLTPRGSPDDVPLAATAPQDLPIDLSLKNKSPNSLRSDSEDERSISSSPHGALEEDREDKGEEEKEKEEGNRRKTEQEAPLDLSSVRTG